MAINLKTADKWKGRRLQPPAHVVMCVRSSKKLLTVLLYPHKDLVLAEAVREVSGIHVV